MVRSFVLIDQHLTVTGDDLTIHEDGSGPLSDVLEQFAKALDGLPHGTALGRTA